MNTEKKEVMLDVLARTKTIQNLKKELREAEAALREEEKRLGKLLSPVPFGTRFRLDGDKVFKLVSAVASYKEPYNKPQELELHWEPKTCRIMPNGSPTSEGVHVSHSDFTAGRVTVLPDDAVPEKLPLTLQIIGIMTKLGISKVNDYYTGYSVGTRGRECTCVSLSPPFRSALAKPGAPASTDLAPALEAALIEKGFQWKEKEVTERSRGTEVTYYFLPRKKQAGIIL
jgi:hypothetical protein